VDSDADATTGPLRDLRRANRALERRNRQLRNELADATAIAGADWREHFAQHARLEALLAAHIDEHHHSPEDADDD
jgi:hypothetical protein